MFSQVLWIKSPNSVFGPQTPKILNFFKFFGFPIFNSLICFQQALNHYHMTSHLQDMPKLPNIGILGPLCCYYRYIVIFVSFSALVPIPVIKADSVYCTILLYILKPVVSGKTEDIYITTISLQFSVFRKIK